MRADGEGAVELVGVEVGGEEVEVEPVVGRGEVLGVVALALGRLQEDLHADVGGGREDQGDVGQVELGDHVGSLGLLRLGVAVGLADGDRSRPGRLEPGLEHLAQHRVGGLAGVGEDAYLLAALDDAEVLGLGGPVPGDAVERAGDGDVEPLCLVLEAGG